MPELPELEGLKVWLTGVLGGRTIETVRLRSVAALKTYNPPLKALEGEVVRELTRRGKYLAFETPNLSLVVHLSLGGWIRWSETVKARKPSLRGPIVAEIDFEGGRLDITEQGKEKRLAMWVVRTPADVPAIADLGPDVLDPALDPVRFMEIVSEQPGTIKRVLADQHVIAGIGNAYSDEILHVACLSPFARPSTLDADQLHRLFEITRLVLSDAQTRASTLTGPDLKDDKRSHFRVHARTGQPCPECGDVIRDVWMGNRSFQYCPTCQAEGRVYADRRLSKLLK